MYLSIKDKGKTLWTHTSLVAEEKAHYLNKLHSGRKGFQNKSTFLSTYLSLEIVNRFAPLKKKSFLVRTGVVAGTLVGSYLASGFLYNSSIEREVRKQLDGAPVWDNKYEVPELDKKFFFLDDDNGFEPSLWHHGISTIEKPKKFFRLEH